MSKIYLVVSCSGEYEDYLETVEKAFADFNKAATFKNELEQEEQKQRDLANRCLNCNGADKDCPMYMAPFYKEDPCESYNPWHIITDYRIDEVEYLQ